MVRAESFQDVLAYSRDTGILVWRKTVNGRAKAGAEAGCVSKCGSGAYRMIRWRGVLYGAHNIIWMLEKGRWPDVVVDHIDGDGCNNKWENLREVSHVINTRNQRRRKANTSGVPGVRWRADHERWHAYIRVNYKRIDIGTFNTKEEAVAARLVAQKEYGFHENHGRAQ